MKLNALGYNGPDAVIRFYNNISWEKRKFPAFEQNGVRQADLDASGGLSRGRRPRFASTRSTAPGRSITSRTLVDILYPD